MVRRKIIMPELPEVETVTKILKPLVINRTISDIKILRKQTIIGDYNEFYNSLKNEKFLDITRIGKFIIFHLTNQKVIISHLRMEGKYYLVSQKEKDTTYSRIVFYLDDGNKLCYDDSRCFGIMILSNENNYKNEREISKLGPEPFDVKSVDLLLKKCKNKKLPIKTTLLDQSLIAGLGNIYVDETLFASKIHPLTPAYRITKEQWENIIKNAQNILKNAIEAGGSTIKSYHPGKDIDGKFQNNLKAYGKANQKCPCCGATFRFLKIRGRGTTFCPSCQKKVGSPFFIALTGKIASGKSTVLSAFKEAGFATLSSDDVVASLYKDTNITNKIKILLHVDFPGNVVDKKILRENIIIHPENKRKLERFIHPLVAKEIIKFLKTDKSQIKVVEVPLLFETGLDALFDTIIVTDITEEKQKELLLKRDKEKAMILKEINKSNKIEANKGKAAYIIENNSTLENFQKQINKIICKLKDSLD